MSVKIIAFALIGAAAVGTVALPTMWHALPHTMRVPFEAYDEVARVIFAQPLPDSVEVMDCAIRQTPAGKNVDEVLGCSLSVDGLGDQRAAHLFGRIEAARGCLRPLRRGARLTRRAGPGTRTGS